MTAFVGENTQALQRKNSQVEFGRRWECWDWGIMFEYLRKSGGSRRFHFWFIQIIQALEVELVAGVEAMVRVVPLTWSSPHIASLDKLSFFSLLSNSHLGKTLSCGECWTLWRSGGCHVVEKTPLIFLPSSLEEEEKRYNVYLSIFVCEFQVANLPLPLDYPSQASEHISLEESNVHVNL